jgi:hypothetical protein
MAGEPPLTFALRTDSVLAVHWLHEPVSEGQVLQCDQIEAKLRHNHLEFVPTTDLKRA